MRISKHRLRQIIREELHEISVTQAAGKFGKMFGAGKYAVDCGKVGKMNPCAQHVRYKEKFHNLSGEELADKETQYSCPQPDLQDECDILYDELKTDDKAKGEDVKGRVAQVKQSLRSNPIV